MTQKTPTPARPADLSPVELIEKRIFSLREPFLKVAASSDVNFEREAGFALQILTSNDYILKLANADFTSVYDSVTNIAAIGLSLNPARKQGYLVPRKNKICLDISYMGLVDLAISTGSIVWAQADIVREKDTFKLRGLGVAPLHERDPFDTDRGGIRGAYVVVKLHNGEYLTHTMTAAKIWDIRDRSEAWKGYMAKAAKKEAAHPGPWGTDEEEMIKKTVVKQAYKMWPKTEKTERLDMAIHHLNTEGGEGLDALAKTPHSVQEWLDKVHETTTDAEAVAVYQKGVEVLKKNVEDAKTFKRAVLAHRQALKDKADNITDVEAKPPRDDQPVITFDSVLAAINSAKTTEQLDEAVSNIPEVEGIQEREELEQQAEIYRVALGGK